jgi:MFS family permease
VSTEVRCWRNVAVLSLSIIGTITALFSWSRLTSLYLRHLGATDEQAGWAFLALVVAYRGPQALGGLISDRVGRKLIVVLGTLAMAACFVGIAFAPSWPLVVAANCLCWMVGALQWPALLSLVADSVPAGERGKAVAFLEAASMLGVTLGPFVGERVQNRLGGLPETWRVLLLGTVGVYALCGIARGLLLREVRPAARSQGKVVVPWRATGIPMAVTVLSFSIYFLTTDGPTLGFYIVDEAHGTPATVQQVGYYGGLGAIAGALLAGWLSDRLGAGRTMFLTMMATGGILALLLRASGRADLRLFSLLFLPGEAFLVAYSKLITTLAPAERRALAVGIVGTAVGLGASWAMPAAGRLYAMDHRAPLVAAAALQGLACVIGIGLLRRSYNEGLGNT